MNPPQAPRFFVEWEDDDLVVKVEVYDYGPVGATTRGIHERYRVNLADEAWRKYTTDLLKALGIYVPLKPHYF